MNADAVLRELTGLHALARSLVHGDADADDLIQDAAIAAIEHPPAIDRPVRPWLAIVLRNRRRMDLRADRRRRAREESVADELVTAGPDAALERARVLERLAAALVALDEPFRQTVMRRYLDGHSAADIARAHGVPAATVRSRLKTGLERLRAALDKSARGRTRSAAEGGAEVDDDKDRKWRAVLAPVLAGAAVKSKVSIIAVLVVLLLLLGIGAVIWKTRGGGDDAATPVATQPGSAAVQLGRTGSAAVPTPAPVRDPLPGQGRAVIELVTGDGGVASGRVINWSTGDGVDHAELTFTSDAGATTVHSRADGSFELAPIAPGRFALTAIAAQGFLPFAPELLHSSVHLELTRERAVRGITVFLFPAIDYHGKVVDKAGAPVAGARVRLLGTPTGEQAIDKLETEWTTASDGTFTFHAADDAVFEAVKGKQRGWARLDGGVELTRQLVIGIDDVAARDATITGRVVDKAGKPVVDVLVRAQPADVKKEDSPRATAFATSGADGTFTLEGCDRGAYDLAAQYEGKAPVARDGVPGGTRNITLVLDDGVVLAGVVESPEGAVPAYTLLVSRRIGTVRDLILARSIVDASGKFEVRVEPGEYELVAAASGWAPSARVTASAGDKEVRLRVSAGATLRGTVVAAEGGAPLGYARVMREASGGGASAQPANAGTVTRADGTFELTGIPPGPLAITIGAGGFHPKIEAGMQASDGARLGPLTVALTALKDGEQPTLELVGIGVQLSGGEDALIVQRVIEGGGAQAAGIVAGDRVIAVDGVEATKLGVDGAVAKIRGVAGTTVSVTVKRGDQQLQLTVERRKLRA
ncbi:MAG: sigma-70 family RNA polymerase sigma factor [Kofleriaceae bacterium]